VAAAAALGQGVVFIAVLEWDEMSHGLTSGIDAPLTLTAGPCNGIPLGTYRYGDLVSNQEEIERIMRGPGTLAEKGEAVSHFVARLRAARKQPETIPGPAFRKKGTRLPENWITDPRSIWLNGGYLTYMLDRERRVIDEARRQIAEQRPYWRQDFMEMLELHLKNETDPDVVAGLKRELRKVRRALGLIKPTPEMVREQTRDRVRRHRAAAKERAISLQV
jgi:hypothetical protein